MFVGPWDQGGPYNPTGMTGIVRWLNRLWSLVVEPAATAAQPGKPGTLALRRVTHKTIEAATSDIEQFRFNTMISRLMEHSTALQRARDAGVVDGAAWDEGIRTALLLTAPLAPHITEELWSRIGGEYSIHNAAWPKADPAFLKEETIELVVQVNGKVRDRATLPANANEDEARAAVFALPRIAAVLDGQQPRKLVYVPGKLMNIVV